jgi:hypothetical protein
MRKKKNCTVKDSPNPLKKGVFCLKRRFLPKKCQFVNTLLKLVAEYSFSLQLKNQTYA